jgi:hypothetical protein
MPSGRKLFDFTAYRYRIVPLETCEGQFYGPLPSAAIEAKIHDCDIPDFSAVLRIEDFSDLLDLDFG